MPVTTNQRTSRCLFKWSADYGLDSNGKLWGLSGNKVVTATFDRGGTTGAASAVDANGRVYVPGYKTPRWHYVGGTRYLLLEGSSQNVCLRSEALNTAPWATVSGTPTITEGADTSCGISLSSVNDSSAVQLQGQGQTITFTGDAVKSMSMVVKQGTSSTSMIRLTDSTAGQDRLKFILTWSGGAPSVSVSTGAQVGSAVALAGSCYRLLFTTTSVTAANANSFQIYPACDAGASAGLTGTLLIGGVMAQNAAFPSSYVPSGASAVTRAVDNGYFSLNAPPQASTIYVKGIYLAANTSTTHTFVTVGSRANTAPQWYIAEVSGNARSYVDTSGTDSDSTQGTLAYGNLFEVRATITSAGVSQVSLCINGGTENTGAAGSTPTAFTAWQDTVLMLNSLGAGSSDGFNGLQKIIYASGAPSLATLRTL